MKKLNLKLHLWQKKKEALDKLQAEEAKMRSELVQAFFPQVVEGQQSKPLGRGWTLFCNCVHEKTIDEKALTAFLKTSKKLRKKDLVEAVLVPNDTGREKLTAEQKEAFNKCTRIERTTFGLKIQDTVPF